MVVVCVDTQSCTVEVVKQGKLGVSLVFNIQDILDLLRFFTVGWAVNEEGSDNWCLG